MEGKEVATRSDREIALYELETLFAMATRQRELLEKYIRERLKPDKHYYKVREGQKPSLTKEGAELICLPHALKAHYEWIAGPENPPMDNKPFQITMKCILEANGEFKGEGIGSASSYITTREGEYKPRQKDPGLCHNATVKMSCKSSYVAATLNSTAASEFFTQDLEDGQSGESKQGAKEHWCEIHQTKFFKTAKMKSYAHPVKDEGGADTGEWCYEKKATESSKEKAENGNGKPNIDWGKVSKLATKMEIKGGFTKMAEILKVDKIPDFTGTEKEALDKLHEWAQLNGYQGAHWKELG